MARIYDLMNCEANIACGESSNWKFQATQFEVLDINVTKHVLEIHHVISFI